MKLYNTLTRKIEEIKPLENTLKMYTCGLTVYSQPQIGNWVAYIYSDVLTRALKDAGFAVTRAQNITDVGHLTSDEDAGEDKMLKGALSEGLTAWEVAEKYIKVADYEAFELLGLLRPDYMPRATEYIPQQIAFVKELEKRGYTYVINDGVYFDTSKLAHYGELARLDIQGLQFGARVADTGKKNPTDFAVWKFSDPAEKRDMEWESPWGKGFPGWHLECSVMAREVLGDQIDIHTGGIDHIPVHHTNEIAQTESVTGKQFSQMWFHNNHLKVDGTKLSKSLGNSYTLQDILDRGFELDAFKLTILSKHYRTEGNFTWDIIDASRNRLLGYRAAAARAWQPTDTGVTAEQTKGCLQAIREALQNDLNTPEVLATLSDFTATIDDRGISSEGQEAFKELLSWLKSTLGIQFAVSDITDLQKGIISERETARAAKNWQKSDELRDQLIQQGIGLNDTATGATWYYL